MLSIMGRIRRICWYCLRTIAAYPIGLILRLRKSYRNVWLISERGDDARDNGYHFFKYLRRNHPEINCYFIIDEKSVDFPKVNSLGNTVAHNSFRHFVLFSLATTRISTHAWGGDVPYVDYYKKLYLHKASKKKFVFLQHGITKDYLPSLMYPQIQPDLFVCGAKPEYDFVKREFGYPEEAVRYTGFARYDNLNQKTNKNQILIMPTFRKWLQGMTSEEFINSQYFQAWNDVLQSEEMAKILDEYNITLVFYPHYEMQKYVSCFHTTHKNVKIADFDHYDVQQLLIESRLLITDFSSVFFDFGFMEKPVIYYHFDRAQYIKGHYDFTKGYFSYDRDGFGEVVFHKENLIGAVAGCVKQSYQVSQKYQERIETFFLLKDQHNCERIYDAVMKR